MQFLIRIAVIVAPGAPNGQVLRTSNGSHKKRGPLLRASSSADHRLSGGSDHPIRIQVDHIGKSARRADHYGEVDEVTYKLNL